MASLLKDLFTRAEVAGEKASAISEKSARKRRDIERMLPHVGSMSAIGLTDDTYWHDDRDRARDPAQGGGFAAGSGGGGGGAATSAPLGVPGAVERTSSHESETSSDAGSPTSVSDTLAFLRDYEGLRSYVEQSAEMAGSWLHLSDEDRARHAPKARSSVGGGAGGGPHLWPSAEVLSASAPAASWVRHSGETWHSSYDE